MMKIRNKNRICHVNSRALDITQQNCKAYNSADQCNSPNGLPDWKQIRDGQLYQIEAEQKRALALMYASRNLPI